MTVPSSAPKEEPRKDVGSTLKQRRMLRGQSLETAHQHTRIPKKFLQAMEDNAFDVFPAPVYLRGFLKGYCDFLDLEFEPLWAQLSPKPAQPAAAGEAASGEPSAPAGGAPGAKAAGEPPARPGPEGKEAPLVPPLSESAVLPVLIFAGLLIMAVLLWALKSKRPARASAAPSAAPVESPARPGPAAPPSAPPAAAPAASTGAAVSPAAQPPAAGAPGGPGAPSAPRAERGTLRLTALKGIWIRLETDGQLMFEGNFPGGMSQDFKARSQFRLRTAEPQALSATLDGAAVDFVKLPAGPDGTRTIQR